MMKSNKLEKGFTEVPVIVYGTLMRGEANHRLLKNSKFLGEVKTALGFELVDLGWYPAMIIGDGQKQVTGELYSVSQAVLRSMDRLEGHPDYYRRIQVSLEDGKTVQTYLFPRQKTAGFPRIASGNWRQWQGMKM